MLALLSQIAIRFAWRYLLTFTSLFRWYRFFHFFYIVDKGKVLLWHHITLQGDWFNNGIFNLFIHCWQNGTHCKIFTWSFYLFSNVFRDWFIYLVRVFLFVSTQIYARMFWKLSRFSVCKVFSRAGHYTSKILILSFQIFLGIYVLVSCWNVYPSFVFGFAMFCTGSAWVQFVLNRKSLVRNLKNYEWHSKHCKLVSKVS